MAALMQKISVSSSTARSNLLAAPPAARRSACFQPVRPLQSTARVASRQLGASQVVSAAQQDVLVREGTTAVVDAPQLPAGYHWYETMMILKTTLSDEERDRELAKFEAFLNKEECQDISALVRGRAKLAYSIKNNWEGIYVLYNYAARRQTARTIQGLLSNPESGSEDNVLRHITFCKS